MQKYLNVGEYVGGEVKTTTGKQLKNTSLTAKKRFVEAARAIPCRMQFLFHTVMCCDDALVYYTIYQVQADTFLAEVHGNPKNVATAGNITLYRERGEWKSSPSLSHRQLYWFTETLQSHYQKQ